jgi:uncharacterized membrane protein YbhN (UPF0104 family)
MTAAPRPERARLRIFSGPRTGRSVWATIGAGVIFLASVVVLWTILSEVDVAEVRAALRAVSREQFAFALLCTAASYGLLTGYDALALRQLRADVPYRTTALASFTSYAVSFTLGFPLVTGGTVRYWIYAPRGLSAAKVASLTLIAGITFWLGMGLVIGVGLIIRPEEIGRINALPVSINRSIGIAVIVCISLYLLWVAVKRRAVRIQRWLIHLPNLPVSIGQLMLGTLDVFAAAGVLWFLLPDGHGIPFTSFAAIYAFACILGIVSHAPGGLGVFEATMLLAFTQVPRESMIGALVLFRLCYYLLPFVLALAMLGAYEITGRMGRYRRRSETSEHEETG